MMKIEVLYPEVANLCGDLQNIEYLAKCCEAEVITTSLKTMPSFVNDDVTLVYMGSTTEKGEELIRDALIPYKEDIKKRIDEGGLFLITGNALEIFGEKIVCDDGMSIPMLGIYDTYAKRQLMNRYNSLYLGQYEDTKIIGFKSQFGHSYGDGTMPLFETIRGDGLNPEVKGEGIRINNYMATYVIGPLLIMNPEFNLKLQSMMGVKNPTLIHKSEIMDLYHTRLAEFSEPDRGFIY